MDRFVRQASIASGPNAQTTNEIRLRSETEGLHLSHAAIQGQVTKRRRRLLVPA